MTAQALFATAQELRAGDRGTWGGRSPDPRSVVRHGSNAHETGGQAGSRDRPAAVSAARRDRGDGSMSTTSTHKPAGGRGRTRSPSGLPPATGPDAASGSAADPSHGSEGAAAGRGREAAASHRRTDSSADRGKDTPGPVWAERDRGADDQSAAGAAGVLLGSDPVDDRSRGGSVGRARALGGLLHHPAAIGRERGRGVLRGASGGQGDRRVESAAGDQGARPARREVDHSAGARAGAGRRDPDADGRHRPRGRAVAGRRPGGGRSVRADGRVATRGEEIR